MRCKKMKLESYSGIENKLFFIKDYLKKEIEYFECGYVGNDLNDYHVMEIFKYNYHIRCQSNHKENFKYKTKV